MDTGTSGNRRLRGSEWAALILLPIGGFLAGIGWLVGVALLWMSPAWTRSEKLMGTLVPVGGLLCPLWLIGRASGPSPLLGIFGLLALAAAVLVPLWLVLLAHRRPAVPAL